MRLIDADELLTAFPVDDEPTLTKACVRMTIQHMPTIELERKEKQMIDLISRQAAITNYQRVCRGIACNDCPFLIRVTDTLTDCRLERFLHDLPSAERKGKWVSVENDLD